MNIPANPARTEPLPDWHALPAEEALARLQVDPRQGLDEDEAARRRADCGPNRLAQRPPRGPGALFLDQFKGALILILLAAAALAGAVGEIKDALVILAVVLINALLGFYQEYRAERSLAALQQMLAPVAEVRRERRPRQVPAAELVPGDIVLLAAGDRVPADGRLLVANGLEADESSLTGESTTVAKHCRAIEARCGLAERGNLLFMNTIVTRGRAELLVTATGMATETGRLAGLLAAAGEGPTPLQIQLDGLGKRLAVVSGAVVALMLVSGLLRGEPWVQMVMTAIALAVAAIPEGLPAVVTVTLALGLRRMARQRALVKRLAAVETLGCTSVICADKTGTLTVNQMTARALYLNGRHLVVTGEGYEAAGTIHGAPGTRLPDLQPLLLPLTLCNDARVQAAGQVTGDPMEGALLVLAGKAGLDAEALARHLPRVAEIPFDAAHRFMASFHLDGSLVRVLVKGAPEALFAYCTRSLGENGPQALDATARAAIETANEQLARAGLRVLGAAVTTVPTADFTADGDLFAHVRELCFVGLVGLMDPPRPEAREAIALCRRAGIQVKMITGDQRVTASAIARELGLEGRVLTSEELTALDEDGLAACIEDIGVFARSTPEQKVRIVRALKARGHVVAMTGDGVNDAPALKSADIGVAMGRTGTDVAREAATMILTDDNFATIVRAVREGRTIYDNLIKFVRFQLSTNIGAILTVLCAPFLGLPLPLNPIQLLWVNIIMDGPPAMALGVDPPQPDVMARPPRGSRTAILTLRRLGNLAAYGITMAAGTLGVLAYGLSRGDEARALTLTFTTFVLFQIFNAFNARAERRSAFGTGFFRNPTLWGSLAMVLCLQILVVHWSPARAIFGTVALTAADWLLATAVASSVLILDEVRKLLQRGTWRGAKPG